MDKKSLLKNIVLFVFIFLALNLLFKGCQPSEEQVSTLSQGEIGFMTTSNTYTRTDTVTVEIQNNKKEALTLPAFCPEEPFDVFHYENAEWKKIESKPELDCSQTKEIVLEPTKSTKIAYDNWNHSLFSQMGRFKIEYTDSLGKVFTTNEFTVEEEGTFSRLWNAILYRPTYNALLFFAYIAPGHNLGIAIILLTILIRTILLIPSQKAMKAQRRMQEVQPKLEEIKEKHKGDQQKIAAETMALWKEQKVNPMGSCLPLLLQFPVLIALFWVIKNGLNPDTTYMLYAPYANFTLSDISTSFLGLNLLNPNLYILPVIVGILQFVQMKLSFMKKGKPQGKQKDMAMANNMMTYIMPVMIAVFTASLPSGVGVYWGVSTIYGIVQQFFVNKDPSAGSKTGSKKEPKNSDGVTVRVVENK